MAAKGGVQEGTRREADRLKGSRDPRGRGAWRSERPLFKRGEPAAHQRGDKRTENSPEGLAVGQSLAITGRKGFWKHSPGRVEGKPRAVETLN